MNIFGFNVLIYLQKDHYFYTYTYRYNTIRMAGDVECAVTHIMGPYRISPDLITYTLSGL